MSPVTFIGSLTFDGNGNITSGAIKEAATAYGANNTPGATTNCSISATGTYTLNSNTFGTLTLSLAGPIVVAGASSNQSPLNGCYPVPSQIPLSIQAAQQGQVFVFQMAAGTANVNFSGSGYKQ